MERLLLAKDKHPKSLERLCAAALSGGDLESAFMYADRRCRIQPFAKSHHFVLRAEVLMRLGDHGGGVADIEAALALSPQDIQANRRMLAWGDAGQKIAAARALVALDDEVATLVDALNVLSESGCNAVAAVRVLDETIVGWAAWNGTDDPVVLVKDAASENSTALRAEPDHPLGRGAFEHAASFHVRRGRAPEGHTVSLTRAGERFFQARCPANAKSPLKAAISAEPRPGEAGISVIIPVYRDLAATRDCLESLLPEIKGHAGRRAIVVNDATPEPKLEKYLRSFCRKAGFTLLRNADNLGFVGSVNRALAQTGTDDVVLLNADTVLPPGCIDRLAAIARSDAAIGTVTPLSNNGEFTSFPVAFEQNPLPSPEAIAEIDRIAATVNDGRIVELPNGIGFCMYVTRTCLDAVGELSQSYQRGYLEDVDFCLRAREHGFRNVCAASVYVGHHGSRSFGADKRALVVRNIAITETKFPDYRQECALFMAADPLRSSRRAIERYLVPVAGYDQLLICGDGLLKAVARQRAEALRSEDKTALILAVERVGDRTTLRLEDPCDDAPQSLTFDIGCPAGLEDLRLYVEQIAFDSVEIVEPAAVSGELLRLIEGFGRPVRVLAADAGVLCPRGTLFRPDGQFCASLHSDDICESCASSCTERLSAEKPRERWRARWKAFARDLEAPCDEAREFATQMLSPEASVPARVLGPAPADATPPAGGQRIGLVVQGRSRDEFCLIQQLMRAAVSHRPEQTFVVLGSTVDDLALMGIGNTFVSGPVELDDYATVLQRYGIGRIFLPLRRPLYGHPAFFAARRSKKPLAYFDWSFGHRRPRADDLAIDPRCDVADLLPALARWGGF